MPAGLCTPACRTRWPPPSGLASPWFLQLPADLQANHLSKRSYLGSKHRDNSVSSAPSAAWLPCPASQPLCSTPRHCEGPSTRLHTHHHSATLSTLGWSLATCPVARSDLLYLFCLSFGSISQPPHRKMLPPGDCPVSGGPGPASRRLGLHPPLRRQTASQRGGIPQDRYGAL